MKLAEILTGPDVWWRGWRNHPVGPQGGSNCLMLGASQVEPSEDVLSSEIPPGHRRMMRILGVTTQREAIAWNDAPERTWDEVASVVEAYDRDRMLNP